MKILIFLLFLLALSGCKTPQAIPAVSGFETDKYLGQWYEIARLPNWFEKDMSDVSAEYSRQPDNWKFLSFGRFMPHTGSSNWPRITVTAWSWATLRNIYGYYPEPRTSLRQICRRSSHFWKHTVFRWIN